MIYTVSFLATNKKRQVQMSEEKMSREEAFEKYINEISRIVQKLESITARKNKLKESELDLEENFVVDDELNFDSTSELDEYDYSYVQDKKKKHKRIKESIGKHIDEVNQFLASCGMFDEYDFNLERLINKLCLSYKERLILYVLVHYSLYSDTVAGLIITVRRLLELISYDTDVYITYYHLISKTSKLMSNNILKYSAVGFSDEQSVEFLEDNIAFADGKLFASLVEQTDFRSEEIGHNKNIPRRKEASSGIDKFENAMENITPKDIVAELDKYVIGQDATKKVLAVQAYLHYMRVKEKAAVPLRSNIMLIGPTGVGKTYIATKLADILGLPFVRSDVTTLTETGYVGDDVEIVLHDLFRKSSEDLSLAEKGIVFLDEVDKIAKAEVNQSTTGNPSDKAVQEALLSMLNGEEVRVPESGDRRIMHSSDGILMNTKNILFIFGGAFVGLDDIIYDRIKGDRSFGFNTSILTSKKDKETILSRVDVKDLEKFGMIPEFLGRIPIISVLQKLGKRELLDILMKSADSPYIKYQEFFKSLDKRFIVSDDAMTAIVDRALNMDMGARSLKSVFETIMIDVIYAINDNKATAIRITKKDVLKAYENSGVFNEGAKGEMENSPSDTDELMA